MSRDQSSSANPLPSGSYVIWGPSRESVMSAKNLRWGEKIIVTEKTLPIRWDVLFDVDQKGYTIQIHEEESFIDIDGAKVVITSSKQFYDIIPYTKGNKVYYIIRSQIDKSLLQYNGINREVTAKQDATSPLWEFKESNADILESTGSYSVYSRNKHYFVYSASKRILDRFGLTPKYTWTKFWDEIKQLNEQDPTSAIYKVIFFARHGEAFNNISGKYKKLKESDDNDDDDEENISEYDSLEWDPNLTQKGYLQVLNAQTMWIRENSLQEGAIGVPEISYCSPLTRCMVTNSITFAPQLSPEIPKMDTLIVADLREKYYNEGERPKSKEYIELVFEKFSTEGYTDPVIPSSKESKESVMRRARAVLDKLFTTESKDKIFVSMTAHSDILSELISILGVNPGVFPLHHTACIFPIICQYTPPKGPDDGYYKIERVSVISLNNSPPSPQFADAEGEGNPVEAVSRLKQSPTTWYVECVDKDKQLYTIKYYVGDQTSEEADLYWNKVEEYVKLESTAEAWRVVSADENGDYYIEWVDEISQNVEYVEVKDNGASNQSLGEPLVVEDADSIGGSRLWKFIAVDV